jgi:hypothetical protein
MTKVFVQQPLALPRSAKKFGNKQSQCAVANLIKIKARKNFLSQLEPNCAEHHLSSFQHPSQAGWNHDILYARLNKLYIFTKQECEKYSQNHLHLNPFWYFSCPLLFDYIMMFLLLLFF